jgi:hypothetical protein
MNLLKVTHRFFVAFLIVAAPLIAFSTISQLSAANNETGWSLPVNGLQARLSLAKKEKLNGTPLIATYLELRNVADVVSAIELPINLDTTQFEVLDEQNNMLPRPPVTYDEVTAADLGSLRMPHDSYLRFNISHRGAGVPKDQAGLLDLGAPYVWAFSPGDKHTYYLRARLSVEPGKHRTWSGTIELPKVKIPTHSDH